MTANKEMTSSFLANSRTTSYSNNKRSITITWDCTPGRVYYNYVIPGGSTQRKGCYDHEGIRRYENGEYKAISPRSRRGLFEGVKCVKIQTRKNGGSWTTVENSKGVSSSDLKKTFTSSKNGDVYEIKCTYQVWTMGSPFRTVPFMWFGTTAGVYNEGQNKFSQSAPASPGRTWSGMRNYTKSGNEGTDQNSSWSIVNYSWYQPNSTSKTTNWSYLHAKEYYEEGKTKSNGWLSTYACEKWLSGMPYGTDAGWTGNVSGLSPQKTRKSSWWTFQRTFTNTYTVSGINEAPEPLTAPTCSLKVVDNLSIADDKGRLNGISGKVQLTYKQSAGEAGTYKLWAYQSVDGSLVKTQVANGSISNNQTKTITVNFTSHSTLKRSKTIGYYAEAYTVDDYYNKTLTGVSTSSTINMTNLIKSGSHFYNEEPKYSSKLSFEKLGNTNIKLDWNKCTDPDGHSVSYKVYVSRTANATVKDNIELRVKSADTYVTKTISYHDVYDAGTGTTYTLNTSKYNDGEYINIYLVPTDPYYNNYYYANAAYEMAGANSTVALEVIDNMTVKDSSGKLNGDHGTIKYTYTHKDKLPAVTLRIYAYIADATGSNGTYACRVLNEANVKSGASGTLELNFNNYPEFVRGRKIKYFAVATDEYGDTSYYPYSFGSSKMWNEAKGYHYFNSVPSAVTPFMTEDKETAYDDDYVELAWPKSTDPEGHEVHYKMYIQVAGDTPKKEVFYFNNLNEGQEVKYTKCIDLGASTVPTTSKPYFLDMSDYIGREVKIWIKTYDKYNAEKYLSGSMFNMRSPGVAPDVPAVRVDYAYARDIYGDDKVNGEKGYVSVSYSHPMGRPGSVFIHAICSKIDTGKKATFKNIAKVQLTSGSWSADILIDFIKIFGEEWRSSEIRYYATAETIYGELSVDEDWVPTTSMWNSWTGTHKFNEEPSDVVANINTELGNSHDNIYIEWTKAIDPDDSTIDPMYAIVLRAESDIRGTLLVQGPDGKPIVEGTGYTMMWDTMHCNTSIDLSEWGDGEKFKVYIIPHDDFANSFYNVSNVIEFEKIEYGRPKLIITHAQKESEKGTITIKYEHEDLTKDEVTGKYVNHKDPKYRNPEDGDFDGTVSIYCYVDETYSYNYAIKDIKFTPGQTITEEIKFENICPYSRSHEIKYYILATDTLTKVQNYDADYDDAGPTELTEWYHYYNDEPDDPQPYIGPLTIEEDKYIYDFMYTDIVWDRPYEPDGHDMEYYVYIKTPVGLGEEVQSTTINRKTLSGDLEPVFIEYTRKYRVIEWFKDSAYYSTVQYFMGINEEGKEVWSANLYEEDKCELPFIGIRLEYDLDHLGKEWQENEEYTVVIEARDNTVWSNSYYGVSEPFVYARRKHEPPNEVLLEVYNNLADDVGDGERGTMLVTYTHPEGDIDGTVTIYAYQEGINPVPVYTGIFKNNKAQIVGGPGDKEEEALFFPNFPELNRSKEITYYAVAKDNLVGFNSLENFYDKNEYGEMTEDEIISLKLQHIPYLVPDADGNYGYYITNIDGVMYNEYLVDDEYVGPVRKGFHYYNEEPPSTSPVLHDDGNITYKSARIKWPHVEDPDGHDVSYEIYVAGTDMDEHMNTKFGTFYNDDIPEPVDALIEEEAEIEGVENTGTDDVIVATGDLMYHKSVTIPASLAFDASQLFSLTTEEYSEDTTINIWIVSKDQYVNSYYRSGQILSINKGHKARPIREVYPRNGSTVYAQCPRILIYLGEDDQIQTTYVGWKGEEYNNKQHPQYFSSLPNNNNVIVFKPPTPYTDLSGTKVTFYVYAHNQCSFTERKYVTYTYRNFFGNFADDTLIAIKSDHINAFRKAIDVTRDAYGILTAKYTREIMKNMIFENFDFNETKEAICAVNDLLNNADPSDDLDHVNPLIVNLADLDVVDYEGTIGTTSYNEFLEWARLVYILENL